MHLKNTTMAQICHTSCLGVCVRACVCAAGVFGSVNIHSWLYCKISHGVRVRLPPMAVSGSDTGVTLIKQAARFCLEKLTTQPVTRTTVRKKSSWWQEFPIHLKLDAGWWLSAWLNQQTCCCANKKQVKVDQLLQRRWSSAPGHTGNHHRFMQLPVEMKAAGDQSALSQRIKWVWSGPTGSYGYAHKMTNDPSGRGMWLKGVGAGKPPPPTHTHTEYIRRHTIWSRRTSDWLHIHWWLSDPPGWDPGGWVSRVLVLASPPELLYWMSPTIT